MTTETQPTRNDHRDSTDSCMSNKHSKHCSNNWQVLWQHTAPPGTDICYKLWKRRYNCKLRVKSRYFKWKLFCCAHLLIFHLFFVGWKPILYLLLEAKHQYLRNKSGKPEPIRTKFGIRDMCTYTEFGPDRLRFAGLIPQILMFCFQK